MTQKSTFRPINEDHAIVSVSFSLALSEVLKRDTIAAVEHAHDKWRDTLPALSSAETQVEVGGKNVRAPGVVFAFVRPDASPNWALTVGGVRVTIECYLYTRWERVWAEAKHILEQAIETIFEAQPKIEVKAVELTVKDEFTSPRSKVDFRQLFRESDYLSSHIFKKGALWHCNTGWFDADSSGKLRHLHNLDITSVAYGGDDIAVSISHFQRYVMPNNITAGQEINQASDMMELLHTANKNLLRDTLVREITERIGLD